MGRVADLEESGAGEKKNWGLLGEDGLSYHGEAETIGAVAAPDKGSASRCVGKIGAQLQPMLQVSKEMPVHPITQEGFCEGLVECAWGVQTTNAPCRKERGAFGHRFTPVPLSGKTMTSPVCLSCALIFGKTHAFIFTARWVIHMKFSTAWRTFYRQPSPRLFAWSGAQLDCRGSPNCTWKPEANQCGFASASCALA
ncbi:hypothetical protein O181_054662 [Austropuccinia psidii MF-1]|uniref:Uncharacterized protein n=1 Tax=Austropuccinia psidii MF-1 TaxID=1389203 RepID=A0A9Q3HSQ8_9BASI|nr:hypothetical protein [Austropuccinia psidii MF-1]